MKKIIALLISILMAFTLIACDTSIDNFGDGIGGGLFSGNGSGSGGSGSGGSGSGGSGSGRSGSGNGESEGEGSPVNVFENSPHAADWDSNRYNDWAQGVWDSYVLPDFFPEMPETGVVGDIQTFYTGKHHERWSSGVADIYNENPFESYGLTFYGQDEHLDYIIDALEEEGFNVKSLNVMGEDQFEALKDEWYVHIRSFNSDTEADCERFFDISIVPDQMKLPTMFEGVPLPQFGYAFFEPEYFDEEYEEYSFDTAPTDEWVAQIELKAVTEANVESYKQSLISAGFTETSHTDRYEKNGLFVDVSYFSEQNLLTLHIASSEYMTNYWY